MLLLGCTQALFCGMHTGREAGEVLLLVVPFCPPSLYNTSILFRQVLGNTVLCQISISNVIINKLKPKQCSGRVALAPESLPRGASLCAPPHHHPQKPAPSVMLLSGNRSSGFSCACSGTKQGDKELG